MEKQIRFTAYDSTKTDIDCSDGEIAVSHGIMPYADGAYRSAITMVELTTVPEGYKVIAIHDGRAIIIHETPESNALYYADYRESTATISVEDMAYIGEIEGIRSIAIQNNAIVIATDVGMKHLIWSDGEYSILDWRPRLPTIQFGLQRTACLTYLDRIIVKNEVIGSSVSNNLPGSGASQTHPTTTSAVKSEKTDLSKTIMQALNDAIDRQVLSKGCFSQPFFIRYALRMRDGHHACQSPPILMLPTVLPPRIGISHTQIDDDHREIAIDLSANNVFDLRYRITEDIDPRWASLIDAIDIFISEEIKTYRTDKNAEGYLTTYMEIVESCDTGGGRGRRYAEGGSREAETSAVFDGHYSLGGDNYIDHTFQWTTNHGVWFVAPNPHLSDDICTAHKFYRVASIPYSAEEIKSEFTTLEMSTTDISALRDHETLKDSGCEIEPLPTVLTTYSDQVVMACDRHRLAPPASLGSSVAYIGDGTLTDTEDVRVSVVTRRHGCTYKSTTICRGFSRGLNTEFPRYIYFPDSSAFMLTLTQGSTTYALPLTRHEHMDGAYWWGGLSADCQANTTDEYECSRDIIDDGSSIYTSVPSNTLVYERQKCLGLGECHIIGMCGAMRTPEGGVFGEYPMYAFTDRGVLMLKYSPSDKAFTTAQCIADIRCINPQAIATASGKVVFASTEGLYTVSGSSIKCISEALESQVFDINTLPHIEEILSKVHLSVIEDFSEMVYQRCQVHYDKHYDVLIVSNEDKGYSLLYNFAHKTWSTITSVYTDKIYSDTDLMTKGNTIVRIAEDTTNKTSILITRPIKITKQVNDVDVTRTEILGDFVPHHVAAILYGATRLGRWHLIGSSVTEIVEDYNSRGYRYLRLVCVSRMESGEYLYGALITVSDD